MVNTASRWSAADYAQLGSFVPELGLAALTLLDPRPGELILDVGCGDGVLTERITDSGARVVGLDSSPQLVAAARARGVEAFVGDAEALELDPQIERFGRFDAAFSNAALHWMLNPAAVAAGIFTILKEGGRFVGEMGGAGNLARLRRGLRDELTGRGYNMPAEDPSWYPSVDEFTRLYEAAGFTEVRAQLIERPTDLPAGISGWVRTFRSGLMDLAMVPEGARDEIAEVVERRLASELGKTDGTFFADYVRLRFAMRKPG
ncbi:MAG: class I SAM-dependent methyltransferase [Allosphingosinicella sp.]